MAESYLIYLDVCCLNRPFDDWQQDRIRLEGQTILDIFTRFYSGEWKLVSSEAIEAELKRMVNLEKLDRIRELLQVAENKIILTEEIDQRSQEIEKLGFGLYDSGASHFFSQYPRRVSLYEQSLPSQAKILS
jgi:hypothetical protein